MIKKMLVGLLALILVALVIAWFTVGQGLYDIHKATSPRTAPADYALQDDGRVEIPAQLPQVVLPYNALKNVYWGDLHVHTVESFDAVLFGTTATVEDAYRFAKGEKLRSPGGELMQAGGVPMGGVLHPQEGRDESPTFFAWVGADLMSAPLQRVQVIKGWIDADGATHEKVRDVACSDGLEVDPTTMRCPDNGASVDVATCQTLGDAGAAELIAAWKDPAYDPGQAAFYYVRALQNPTCRWSGYDAIRLGNAPDPRVPASIRERVWSSPIWIDPAE